MSAVPPPAVPPAARAPQPSQWEPAIEVQWHRREVEVFGTLVRVTLPVIGAPPLASLAHRLSTALELQWRGCTLSPVAAIHSVVAEFQETHDGRALVLLISTDHSPRDHAIVNVRMIRDLRHALRTLRSPAEEPDAPLPAAA